MQIIVGSENPIKRAAVSDAFKRTYGFPLLFVPGVAVDSGVSRQPMSDCECIEGALNRAVKVIELAPDVDFAIGIESGLCRIPYGQGRWFERTWAVVLDKNGNEGVGSSASFFVPDFVVEKIRNEKSGLGSIIDACFDRKNLSQQEGYVGVVTNNAVSRRTITCDAVIAALAVFLRPEFFVEYRPK